jgi:ssDNA-binding Zn-finger/Zn-ribbon topoisomerase 1
VPGPADGARSDDPHRHAPHLAISCPECGKPMVKRVAKRAL